MTKKIAFLLGSPDINGGTYVIYEHASRLVQRGYDVAMITLETVEPERHAWHPNAHVLEWLTMEEAESREFDVVLATWWRSPFLLYKLQADHYIYFVQSIESRFFEPPNPTNNDTQEHAFWKELCEGTYSYALPVITEAQWIKNYLHERYNNSSFLVRNGIRKDIYTPDGKTIAPRSREKFRVLVEGPVDVFYKNVPTAITLCQRAGVDEIWLLTSSDISEYPGVDRIFSRVPIHDTPAIYRSCDVLVKLSYIEGMFGPPLEMFHCGGTAIVYKVTGYDEYIVHNENSYAAEPDDEEGVVKFLERLGSDREELQRLKAGALVTANDWIDWDGSSTEFEASLNTIVQGPPTSRTYLWNHTKRLLAEKELKSKSSILKLFSDREKNRGNESESIHNFIQFYYHAQDWCFSVAEYQWRHFKSGDWTTVSFEVEITGFPFWIRIDPGIRVGIVELDTLEIVNTANDTLELSLRQPADFRVLYINGTVSWVENEHQVILFSYGGDPQFILPAVEKGEVGDQLLITMRFKEMSIRQFLDERQC